MVKKQKSKSKAKKQLPPPSPSPSESPESSEDEMNYQSERVTLEQIDAMSDGEEDEIEEWNAEAKALRQAIADGVFDKLKLNSVDQADNDEDDEDEEEDEGSEEDQEQDHVEEDDKSESEEEEEEEETNKKPVIKRGISNEKALVSVTNTLLTEHAALQWPEKFDIVPSTPLPFGTLDAEGQPIMVHDDLKREVAFYNLALDAVHLARQECNKFDIPFTRPDDFFAEMVKTDAHMAMVKDRLIFESKKMEAFEQRKSNREQKLRAKEKHAHRLAEKAKAKKQHMKDVQDWADTAANSRVGGGRVRDNDEDYLNRMNGPNKKRMAANKKYGYGGKRGRFKQNDAKSMNDMSGFNPKGNFAGGQKAGANKRKGKRARDASKARR